MSEIKKISPVELTFQDITLTCPIEDGHRMMPVKTICAIIDVNFQTQDTWLKNHPFFSQLYRLAYTTGADGKSYKMSCLSIFDVGFWIGSITLSNRKEGSAEKQTAFMTWLREQTLGLYKSIELFIEENKYEQELIDKKLKTVDEIINLKDNVKSKQKELKTINDSLEQIQNTKFTGQTVMKF